MEVCACIQDGYHTSPHSSQEVTKVIRVSYQLPPDGGNCIIKGQPFWKTAGELSTDTDSANNTNDTDDKWWWLYRLIFGIAKGATKVEAFYIRVNLTFWRVIFIPVGSIVTDRIFNAIADNWKYINHLPSSFPITEFMEILGNQYDDFSTSRQTVEMGKISVKYPYNENFEYSLPNTIFKLVDGLI